MYIRNCANLFGHHNPYNIVDYCLVVADVVLIVDAISRARVRMTEKKKLKTTITMATSIKKSSHHLQQKK
jgi:hypothetical protein